MDRKEQKRIKLALLQEIADRAYSAYLVESDRLDYNQLVEEHLDKVLFLVKQCIEVLNLEEC